MAKQAAIAKAGSTLAASVSDGKTHAAGVKALHVLLCQEDGGWFAQGLEIDYFASGATLDEAKENFAKGLILTTNEHLLMYGNLKKILVLAPQEAWDEYYKAPPETIIMKELLDFVTAISSPAQRAAAKAIPFDVMQFIPRETPVEAVAAQ